MTTDERTPGGDGASVGDRRTASYWGHRTAAGALVCRVTEDGSGWPLSPRTDLCNHSPTGLEWGYGGSGPAQLALAILADALGSALALDLYQDFKWAVIAKLPEREWTITRDAVLAWVASQPGPD